MAQLTRNFLSISHQTLEEKNSMRAVNTSQQLPIVAAMLGGIIPATAGMMCWLAVKFAQPLLGRDGKKRLGNVAGLVMILASFVALAFFKSSVIVVLFVCSIVGVPVFGLIGK